MGIDFSLPVLVVDDHRTIESTTRDLLEKLGFEDVESAPDGPTALEMFRHKNYRLIVCDLQLATAAALLREIRSRPGGGYTRVLMVNADPKASTAKGRAAADGYLVRPFSAEALKAKIEDILTP